MNSPDEQFFVDTVRAKRQALWRMAFYLLRSGADAEDAVSCAVESTWRHLHRIRTRDALAAYLMRSVMNAARDELRRRRHLTPMEPLEGVLEAPERDRGIADYVTGLDEKYRLPLMLKFNEELQEKEIAFILRLPRGTVSSRISRGLEMLKKEMIQEESGHV